jgi:hypothetical protein
MIVVAGVEIAWVVCAMEAAGVNAWLEVGVGVGRGGCGKEEEGKEGRWEKMHCKKTCFWGGERPALWDGRRTRTWLYIGGGDVIKAVI